MRALAALGTGLAVSAGASYAASPARRSPKRRAADAIGLDDDSAEKDDRVLRERPPSSPPRFQTTKKQLRRIAFADLNEGVGGVSKGEACCPKSCGLRPRFEWARTCVGLRLYERMP